MKKSCFEIKILVRSVRWGRCSGGNASAGPAIIYPLIGVMVYNCNYCSLSPLGIQSEMFRKLCKFCPRLLERKTWTKVKDFTQLNIAYMCVGVYAIALGDSWEFIDIRYTLILVCSGIPLGLILVSVKALKIKWKAEMEMKRTPPRN